MRIGATLAKTVAAGLFVYLEGYLTFQVGTWTDGHVFGWGGVLAGAYLFTLFFLLGYLAGKDGPNA